MEPSGVLLTDGNDDEEDEGQEEGKREGGVTYNLSFAPPHCLAGGRALHAKQPHFWYTLNRHSV